ncbi:MAG: hypothetical protein PHD81_04465 [Candidatus Nanoarchaeia archaeon]|nr:hypothetical protein [Candidatus Nanoarchaeia archaeon]MDD5588332.1 hypothetical protein [Candidatus Nanoarchaeia archaeon]
MNALEGKVTKQPWEMEKSQVEIITSYEAKIIGEIDTENRYPVEFSEEDGSTVFTSITKEKFDNFPCPVNLGVHFWIVAYKLKEQPKIINAAVWPISKYWHSSWL